MSSLASRWLGNSAANLIGGLSAALFNVALPALVSRHLSHSEFSAWSLAMQVIAYVNLLGIGLQTATARAIAHANEQDDRQQTLSTLRAAHRIGRWACGLGLLMAVSLAVLYPLVFPGIPAEVLQEFRWTLLIICCGTAFQLLALVPMGVFQGLHRNISFVSVQVALRVVAVALVAIGAHAAFGMTGLAIVVGASTALLGPANWLQLRRTVPWLAKFGEVALERARVRQLLDACATLSVWSVSMLLVNSVGIVMVGRIAFQSSGAYAVSMTAATVLAGLLNAVFAPLMTMGAAMHAVPERRPGIPRLLTRSTLACTAALHLLFAFIWLFHRPILRLWIGASFVEQASPLLLVLVGAHALRNVAWPYALMLLATGLNRRALWTGLAEGFGNLVATIVLGLRYGVVGVALGTLAGAAIGLLGSLLFNTRRTPELTPHPLRFALVGIVAPTLAAAPVYALVWMLLNR